MYGDNNLDIIIVNYRAPDLVIKCANSVLRFGIAAPQNIFVVDNASGDDSFAKLSAALPSAQLIFSDRNAGFGAGINIAAKSCRSDLLMILNPDTYFEDDSVFSALDFLKSTPNVAVAGLDLIYPGGGRQYSARRFYSLLDILGRRTSLGRWLLKRRIDHHLMIDRWQQGRPFAAEWVLGTGFLVRRDIFNQIGGMDESYFLYMEDTDLCARVWQVGYSVFCIPHARLVHDHQRASAAEPLSRAGRTHLQSLRTFRRKFRVPIVKSPGISGIAYKK